MFGRPVPKQHVFGGDTLSHPKPPQIRFCQVLATVPGVLRCCATILGGELLDVTRMARPRFSISICDAGGPRRQRLRSLQNRHALDASTDIAIGFVVPFIVAYFVVKMFVDVSGRYEPFG